MNKTINQKAWFFVIPVFILVAFNAVVPLMTVVNYAFQKLSETMFLLGRVLDGLNKYSDQKDFTQHLEDSFYLPVLFFLYRFLLELRSR